MFPQVVDFVADRNEDAHGTYSALMLTGEIHQIAAICQRLAPLIAQLRDYRFDIVAQMLSGLLINPNNHVATQRVEALIHLAAIACRGRHRPTIQDLNNSLNIHLFRDPITDIEDPAEDVFISNVATWSGNRRLFQGKASNTDYYIQALLSGLSRIEGKQWVEIAQANVNALLALSDAVAIRSGIPPFVATTSQPRGPLTVNDPKIEVASSYVTFADEDLIEMGISPDELNPFVFQQSDHADLLKNEVLGNSSLDRRPLIRTNGATVVVLPTAIGSAVRRYIVEVARASGGLCELESRVSEEQSKSVRAWTTMAWKVAPTGENLPAHREFYEIVGTFDYGGYAHILYVSDDLWSATQEGLQSIDVIKPSVKQRIEKYASEMAKRPDYRYGVSIVVHGGIGRGVLLNIDVEPTGWRFLILTSPDFMRLGWDDNMSVFRAYKLLNYQRCLEDEGVSISNLGGFVNLYAFASGTDYRLVPREMIYAPGRKHLYSIHTGWVAELRRRLRTTLNQHVALGPDRKSLVEVQRMETESRFQVMRAVPMYFSWRHMAVGRLLGCVETVVGPWWVGYAGKPPDGVGRNVVLEVWNMALSWLVPLSVEVQGRVPRAKVAPVTFDLQFPDIGEVNDDSFYKDDSWSSPSIWVTEGRVQVRCSSEYLRSFCLQKNTGDRLMVEALARGALEVCGIRAPVSELNEIVNATVDSETARFVHLRPVRSCRDAIHFSVQLPDARLLQPEDRAWSAFNLAHRVGWCSGPGVIPQGSAKQLLGRAVDEMWTQIKRRLQQLDRVSVVERALLNFEAIEKDRKEWAVASAALIAICKDSSEVVHVASERDARRDLAGLASRVIAEMAISEASTSGGTVCSYNDLDYMVGHVATLLECASGSDALEYGIMGEGPTVFANGELGFDSSGMSETGRYWSTRWEMAYEEEAEGYEAYYEVQEGEHEAINPRFDSAFLAEFGVTVGQYSRLVDDYLEEALRRGNAVLRIRKEELLMSLESAGARDPRRTFNALVLRPREKWDEMNPEDGDMRDWYPWRFGRRLSILRRPIVQVGDSGDSDVLILPTLLELTMVYLLQSLEGYLPVELFDSAAMRGWIGDAVNRRGHAFNAQVQGRLRELGWCSRSELGIREIGGEDSLGDVDVIAWRRKKGLVYAIECKSLRFDRTMGEIGRRVKEYGTVGEGDERTPAGKHSQRMTWLRGNMDKISRLTGIEEDRIQLRSALVTDDLVPMQFFDRTLRLFDLIVDYGGLAERMA